MLCISLTAHPGRKSLNSLHLLSYVFADRRKKNIISGRENEIITEQLCMLVLLRHTMSWTLCSQEPAFPHQSIFLTEEAGLRWLRSPKQFFSLSEKCWATRAIDTACTVVMGAQHLAGLRYASQVELLADVYGGLTLPSEINSIFKLNENQHQLRLCPQNS